jgi:oxidase EvaA
MQFFPLFLESYLTNEGIHRTEYLNHWIEERNSSLEVRISKISLSECNPWFYDDVCGVIRNNSGCFFSVGAIRKKLGSVIIEQPILIQKEIGYLGILCTVIDGVLHFLMQAKIEPGNINTIQISPTLQATKSNFTQMHGGSKPKYLDYFLHAKSDNLIVDQIQSEQSSRFLGKRNRNVILFSHEYIEELDGYKWMTLGQIRQFLKKDNMINMDTRTVLSCIPWSLLPLDIDSPTSLVSEIVRTRIGKPRQHELVKIYQYLNDYKMHLSPEIQSIPLSALENWSFNPNELVKMGGQSQFKVIFCDITIEGREVRHWKQPMFESLGEALFGLIYTFVDKKLMILVKGKAEIGCFDLIEIGPTVQMEYGESVQDSVEQQFMDLLCNKKEGIMIDVIQSEEGGRFFHEQNRNVIIETDQWNDPLPEGYFWCSFATLNYLIQINNCVNIQLRNLLALLELVNE